MSLEPIKCRACGHLNPPGSRFCNACGSSLLFIRPLRLQRKSGASDDERTQAQPEIEVSELEAETLMPGITIDPAGRYMLTRAIGQGGFGHAYLAFDRQLQRYCVAKRQVTNPEWDVRTREQALRNFHREARLLVTLNTPGHPNIPEIYEYLPEQRFLVMKYVEGRDLGLIVHEQGGRLTVEESLTIARDIADALVYMHAREPEPVLHRDIKLANILIDSAGRVWLIDFGLSRVAPVQGEIKPDDTQLAGTLGFTPPEQWHGKAEPRSDIYALSATIYILLTGFHPELTRENLSEFLLGKVQPYPPLRTIDAELPLGVEALLMRGLALEPEQRPDAESFLATVRELLMPISHTDLQAPDGSELADETALRQWAEAHWTDAATWLYSTLPDQVEQLWGRNKLAADMRRAVDTYGDDMHAGLDTLLARLDTENFGAARSQLVTDQRSIDFGALSLDERRDVWLKLSNKGRRYLQLTIQTPRWIIAGTKSVSLPPGTHQRLKLTADMRRVEDSGIFHDMLILRDATGAGFQIELHARLSRWRAFLRSVAGSRSNDWTVGNARLLRTLQAHRGGVWALAFSPDTNNLVSGGADGIVQIWRVADGSLVSHLDEQAGNALNASYSPDGLLIAITASDTGIKIWRSHERKLMLTIPSHVSYQENIYFSYDSQALISNGNDGTIRYWRLRDGKQVKLIQTVKSALSFTCRPDVQVLAVGCSDGVIRLYDGKEGHLQASLSGHRSEVNCVTYSRDGSMFASGGNDGMICLWDGERGTLEQTIQAHQNAIRTLAIHPDGLLIASGGVDGSIKLWRTNDGHLCQTLSGHSGGVLRITFSPEGDLLASGGSDGKVLFWQA